MMTSHLPLTTFTFNDLPLTTYPLPLKQGTALFPPYIAPFHPTFLSINIKIYPPTKPLFHVLKNLKINLLHTPHKVQWLPKHLIKIVWAGEWSREAARDCRQTNILRGCLPANPPASRPLINEIIIKKKPKKRRHANILKAYPPENLPTLWAGDRSTLNRVFLRRAFMPFFASHTYT